jgi:hypothetical protein
MSKEQPTDRGISMAKITRQEKSIFEVQPEPVDHATEMRQCEDRNSALNKRNSALKKRNSALKKELFDCRTAANSDRPLLASGLRLALANEALQGEVAALRKDASKQASDQKAKQSSGQP